MKLSSEHGARSTVHDALLEIGSEELPASFIALGMRQLKSHAEESLKTSGLSCSSIEAFGTPRRLAVVIHGLADRSPDQEKTVTGPPAHVAKDAQGQWTPAALGFARKQGLKPSELKIENDRMSAVLHIKGVATRQLLAALFPQWISKLDFPKSMEWEPSHFHYPRPLRWICALFGSDLVSFILADVRSSRWTLGPGPWSPKKIQMSHPGKYASVLKDQCVLVDPGARQEAIKRFADQAVKRVHGKVHMTPALLEEVANLVEHPVAILGNFDPAYLDLPKEVLVTCLEHHQKYFPVEAAAGGKLLPHFIGIRNGMSVHQEIVREGYERVLAARLADARFFFSQDRRSPLASKVDALKGVMFQQKLGNLFDKKERVKALLEQFSSAMGGFGDLEKAKRVAELCKADLVTDMVREFPELQGIVARLYARADGNDAVVAQALEEHYWPITLTGALPSSDVAAFVALADKLDTLAGDFAVGLIPTGSADPYGLRRAAVGVLRILEHYRWPLKLEALLSDSFITLPSSIRQLDIAPAVEKLKNFMKQRFAGLMEERGYKVDEIEAVMARGIMEVADCMQRLDALKKQRAKKDFEPLAIAFKRAQNIIQQARKAGTFPEAEASLPIDQALLTVEAEKILVRSMHESQGQLNELLQARKYEDSMLVLAGLREPLDAFFKDVMVMDQNPSLRAVRLSILATLIRNFGQIADFSKLQNA